MATVDAPTRPTLDPDIDTIAGLDFQPDIPCEWKWNDQPCTTPAELLIHSIISCGCPNPVFGSCTACWARLGALTDHHTVTFSCQICGNPAGNHRDQAYRIVAHLGGA